MRKRTELSMERVIDELKTAAALSAKQPERVYLVLDKHDGHVYLDTLAEDVEQRLESLMSNRWVPLGFVSYFTDSPKPETRPLNWYADLLRRDERRYGRLYRTVSARVEEAARQLTEQLSEGRVIQRLQ